MKMVFAIPVNDSILTSNVLENDFTAYSAANTYPLDAEVYTPTTHDVYRSKRAGNVGNNPLNEVQWNIESPPVNWQLIGKTNKYKMFDGFNNSQTVRSDNVDITLAVTGRNQAISLQGLDAKTVVVTATHATLGVVFNNTYNLLNATSAASYWDYFFEDAVYSSALLVLDLPNYASLTLRIQIINTGFIAKCGNCIVGKITEVGNEPNYGLTIDLADFSSIINYFDGTNTIIRRASAKKMDLTVNVQKADTLATMDKMQEFLGLPILAIGSDSFAETVVYGIIRDVRYSIPYPTQSTLSLRMDGFI